jgi:hypothetical protein
MTSYDFEVNGMSKFSQTYGIPVKTIKKYLDLFNIEYPREPKKRSGVILKRDRFGWFISNFRNNNVGNIKRNDSWNDEYQRIIESKPIRFHVK